MFGVVKKRASDSDDMVTAKKAHKWNVKSVPEKALKAAVDGVKRKSEKAALIVKADEMISARLGNTKCFCDPVWPETQKVCEEVFSAIGTRGAENHSLLLLGEAGSGKTHIVEWCIQRLRAEHPSAIVLRAAGGAYASDVECLRHLATQLSDRLVSAPSPTASFEQNMEWILNIFKGSFKHASAMVMVIDQFEYFCSRTRQTLLYNLFDVSQRAGVHISVIGTSTKMDAMDSLEKRIRSRFSMRHLHTFLPTTMDDLVQVLMAKLRLPESCGLEKEFLNELHANLEKAIKAKSRAWERDVDLGRPPSWFLAKCRPIMALLPDELQSGESLPKRPRSVGCLASCASHQATMLFLEGCSQKELIVLLALHRLRQRGVSAIFSLALHEIQLLHQDSKQWMDDFNEHLYTASFDILLESLLIDIGSGDAARKHRPCGIAVNTQSVFAELVAELGRSESDVSKQNPLRSLPTTIQQWAVQRQRHIHA